MSSIESEVGATSRIVSSELSQALHEAMKDLTFQQREIIKLRYGIGDGYTYTLEEAGRILKITRERVRQVEAKAIRKLAECIGRLRGEDLLAEAEEIRTEQAQSLNWCDLPEDILRQVVLGNEPDWVRLLERVPVRLAKRAYRQPRPEPRACRGCGRMFVPRENRKSIFCNRFCYQRNQGCRSDRQ